MSAEQPTGKAEAPAVKSRAPAARAPAVGAACGRDLGSAWQQIAATGRFHKPPGGADYRDTLFAGVARRNPAWVQLLGLCPLLAVSNSVVNALALALASTAVLVGSNVSIAALRRFIPEFVRLPAFVLVVATFTTCAVLLMEAYAFEVYLRIALFVQIIVTNCMILARAETFASRQPVLPSLLDGLGTAAGFALALLGLGAVREALGHGTLLAGLDLLFGPAAGDWAIRLTPEGTGLLIATLPPGAFLLAGLLLALGNAIRNRRRSS